jgi:hypothetical protein
MASGVTFIHHIAGTLHLRLAPTSVEWSYKVNTQTTPTFAGEVVQILSIEIDSLSITGRFGREGVWGTNVINGVATPRPLGERRNFKTGHGPYANGLSQMTEYFRNYFSVASQGRDTAAKGNYDQVPMIVSYSGAIDGEESQWSVYPVSFPSYKRTNVDYAPEWQVQFQVEEADYRITPAEMTKELHRLRAEVGYIPSNVFSDPHGSALDPRIAGHIASIKAATSKADNQANQVTSAFFDFYSQQLPTFSVDDLNSLIFASGPTNINQILQKSGAGEVFSQTPSLPGGRATQQQLI